MARMFEKRDPAVHVPTGHPVVLSRDALDDLIGHARSAPAGRARYLMHRDESDGLHEMVIALPRHSCDLPHINFRSAKSFHVLSGAMAVILFSDDGATATPVRLTAERLPGSDFMVRLNEPAWHTIIPLTDYVIFTETVTGPFTGNRFAPWAPEKTTGGLYEQFRDGLRKIAQT